MTDPEIETNVLNRRIDETLVAVLHLIDHNGDPINWRTMTEKCRSCPYCNAGYLDNEYRDDVKCNYCGGSWYVAQICCDMLDFLLKNDFHLIDKETRHRLGEATWHSYYGFEIAVRNRHIGENNDLSIQR
jgi:hypothetical protein